MKTVVITGASTGIGRGTARVLLSRGWRVFGSIRRHADGEKLKAELGDGFMPLLFDVTDRAAIAAAAAQVAEALAGQTLAGLVNNAGIAVGGVLAYLGPDDMAQQLAVNVQGPLNVTQAFLPLLGMDRTRQGKPGRIVMLSSVGGTSAAPFLGAYNSSKFALEGLSEALRRELMLFGIDVLVVAPGPIKTPIWGKSEAWNDTRYANGPYAPALEKLRAVLKDTVEKGLEPEAVGDVIHTALTAAHPKTRTVITSQPILHFLQNHLPSRLVDRLTARMLALTPPR